MSLLSALRKGLRGTQQDFTKGPLSEAIPILAIPMVLEMVGESIFFVCDAYYVTRLGAEPLAAVGLTESLLAIVYAVSVGLSLATTAMVSRRYGEGDRSGAATAGAQALLVGVVVAIVLGVVAALAAPHLLRLMGGTPETVAVGTPYARWMFGGMGTIILLYLVNAVFRGAGDGAAAMRSLWIANAINLVLDPCLIFGLGPFPELGLTGAAVATNIGRGTGVLYQLWFLTAAGDRLRIHRSEFRPQWPVMKRLLRVSVGGVTQFLVSTASWVGMVRILAMFGSGALGGYILAMRIVQFVVLPAWGLSNAAATLVGQNLGANKPHRAARAVWLTGIYNSTFMAGITLIFVLLAPRIVDVFQADENVAPYAAACLRIVSYGYVFYSWGMVMLQAFNGAGDTMTPTRISLVSLWFCQIPIGYLLATRTALEAEGVFWSIAIAYSIYAVASIWVFRKGSWQRARV